MVAAIASFAVPAYAQREDDPHARPVKAVGNKQFVVSGPQGNGVLRYFSTGSLDGDAHAVRAMIEIHGLLRNADEYERTGEAVIAAAKNRGADTLLITPQFLAEIDASGLGLPAETLRWNAQNWLDGYPATAPAPISAFSALDAILVRLADRSRFPALHEIVVVGHSAGGQLTQRYAIVGRAPDAVASAQLTVRFVVANPSSYLYFTNERPQNATFFAPFDMAACPKYNEWKYGVEKPPPYVDGSVADMEARYVTRDVTYMLGQLDIDPNHPVLDKSCSGEAEGPYRLARGESYVRYIKLRHPSGTSQSYAEVAGVDHDALGMFASACGIAVLFGEPRKPCAREEQI
ncbi:MAG: alpha/beta hydrolase [Candidatus Eremiobacteraeota bacterium]|nr:alpha/beta hydrolase [Candidatus Eremiobacteraeota bacterium]